MHSSLSKKFYTAAALCIAVSAVTTLFTIIWYQRLLTPVALEGENIQFEIKEGQTGKQIADNLKKANLIRSSLAFRTYAIRKNIASRFTPGVYYLSPAMDAKAISQAILKGEADIKITFIEGWRVEEYAEKLEQTLDIKKADFLKVAEEGYMFPDTYLLNKKVLPTDVAGTLKANFDKKVTDDIRQKIRSQKLSLEQGITLASIVERESHESVSNERQIIASILLRRLRMGMALETDATVQYALGYDPMQKKWWRVLSLDQLKSTRSLYNTYLTAGLPPAPICNPGLLAIKAVAEASDTLYLFYIHDKNGLVHFAKTLEEHNRNVATYIQPN